MTLVATATLETESKVQYLFTLVPREALYQFDLPHADAENTYTSLTVDYIRKHFVWYLLPVNSLSKR